MFGVTRSRYHDRVTPNIRRGLAQAAARGRGGGSHGHRESVGPAKRQKFARRVIVAARSASHPRDGQNWSLGLIAALPATKEGFGVALEVVSEPAERAGGAGQL